MPNKFGGLWTDQKINIIIKYAKAYLEIMKDKPYRTIYFDGFAGSGDIEKTVSQSLIEGVASQILAINKPCSFNMYYLVELKKRKAERLQSIITEKFPNKQKNVFVVKSDCNDKLVG